MKVRFLMMAGLVGGLTAPIFTKADVITYTVDPTRSFLTISGNYGPTFGSPDPIVQESYGGTGGLSDPESGGPSESLHVSFLTSYLGTIVADRDSTANTIQITSGAVSAQASGNWSPSGLPGNYAWYFSAGLMPGFTIFGEIRNLSFALSSPIISSSTTFDASLLKFTIAGQFDYAIIQTDDLGRQTETDGSTILSDDIPLSSAAASLTSSSGIDSLSIPIETNFLANFDANKAFALHLSGNFVATSPIPEPASLTLIVVPALWLLSRRRDFLRSIK